MTSEASRIVKSRKNQSPRFFSEVSILQLNYSIGCGLMGTF